MAAAGLLRAILLHDLTSLWGRYDTSHVCSACAPRRCVRWHHISGKLGIEELGNQSAAVCVLSLAVKRQ